MPFSTKAPILKYTEHCPYLLRHMLSLNEVMVLARGHHPPTHPHSCSHTNPPLQSLSHWNCLHTLTSTHHHSPSSISRGQKLTYAHHPIAEAAAPAYNPTLLPPAYTDPPTPSWINPCINICTGYPVTHLCLLFPI